VNLETSNLVHWFTIASPTLLVKNLSWKGRGQGQVTSFRILHPFAPANARDFKFCTRVGHVKSQSCDEWVFPKWVWSRSREQFQHCGLKNFATASRRYTRDMHNSSEVGLFMTPIGQRKRLDRVMVECTCLLHIAPLLPSNFITSVCLGLVVQVVSALLRGNWQNFNWHDASRGPSATAELLVFAWY